MDCTVVQQGLMMLSKSRGKSKKLVDQIATLIAEGVKIYGDMHVNGGVQIDGQIIGSIICEDKDAVVRLSDSGMVKGEIRAHNVVLNGHVQGNVFCEEHLTLDEKSVVTGDVHYALIEMVIGAEVNGQLIHDSGQVVDKEDIPVSTVESFGPEPKLT